MKTFWNILYLQIENHNCCTCNARLDTSIVFHFKHLPQVKVVCYLISHVVFVSLPNKMTWNTHVRFEILTAFALKSTYDD
jgi:hypothetical protein